MVNFDKFEYLDNKLVLEDGIFIVIGTHRGSDWRYSSKFSQYSFQLYIKNKDGAFVLMGNIIDEESLKTILNLIEHGKDFVLYN